MKSLTIALFGLVIFTASISIYAGWYGSPPAQDAEEVGACITWSSCTDNVTKQQCGLASEWIKGESCADYGLD